MPRFVRDIDAIPERTILHPLTRKRTVIHGVPGRRDVFECEVDDLVVRIASGTKTDDPNALRQRTLTLATHEAALAHAFMLCRKKVRSHYRLVGRSRVLDTSEAPAWIVVEERFESASDQFLVDLLRFDEEPRLARFAERWLADERPWARAQLLAYVDDGCDRWGHRGLVKRVLRAAEEKGDDELMAHLLVAFDRLVLRVFGPRKRPATRETEHRRARAAGLEILLDPCVRVEATSRVDPSKKKDKKKAARPERFSRATRRYLMRRAWRWFRVLGHRDPARYGAAIRAALELYQDAHLATPLRLLDAWGLMHALFHHAEILEWRARDVGVKPGHTLAELVVSPRFPDTWSGAFDGVVALIARARSRTVRVAVAKILEDRYADELASMSVHELGLLLESDHDEARALGARLLVGAKGGAALSVDAWLRLLAIPSAEVASAVVDALRANLDLRALSVRDLVALGTTRVAPIAELAVASLEARSLGGADIPEVLALRDAPVPSVRTRALALLAPLVSAEGAPASWARDLLDARHADARAVALRLLREVPRLREDPATFAALVESPFGDVQAFAIGEAERALARGAAIGATSLRALWATTVLAVHRGSRAKLAALRQIVDALASAKAGDDPSKTEELLPLLTVALRSVRGPERVAALSALAAATLRSDAVRRALVVAAPELRFGEVASQ